MQRFVVSTPVGVRTRTLWDRRDRQWHLPRPPPSLDPCVVGLPHLVPNWKSRFGPIPDSPETEHGAAKRPCPRLVPWPFEICTAAPWPRRRPEPWNVVDSHTSRRHTHRRPYGDPLNDGNCHDTIESFHRLAHR